MTRYKDIEAAIDRELDVLHRVRCMFPHLGNAFSGGDRRTPEYYRDKGFDVMIEFPENVDAEYKERFNAAGHWVNQAFVVRLYAVLQHHGVVKAKKKWSPNKALAGCSHVYLFCKLRNVLAHEHGSYVGTRKNHRSIRRLIIEAYGEPDAESDVFPLAINTVLGPMVDGLKQYARACCKSESDP